jgi:hypothetical protein
MEIEIKFEFIIFCHLIKLRKLQEKQFILHL